ncbi:MAG: NAD(P)-dependent oxidoreductase [Actinomycetes bacterium]
MRILLADALDGGAVDALERRSHVLVSRADLTADTLPEAVSGFDVLVVRSTRVTASTFAAADQLGLVVRAGSGTNTIDCDAASKAGVVVANVPGANAVAVAELTLGLVLALDRHIPEQVVAARDGSWDKRGFGRSRGLQGATLGVVGLGAIGQAVAYRAAAFGMSLSFLDRPHRSASASAVVERLAMTPVDSLVELAASVDVLTVHVPSGKATAGMVGADVLQALRPGSFFINTSRADVVDSDALLEVLDSGRIRAGLDVFPDEPADGQSSQWVSQLAAHPGVVATHHVGASTRQAQLAVSLGVVDVIASHEIGQTVNVVNPAAVSVGR